MQENIARDAAMRSAGELLTPRSDEADFQNASRHWSSIRRLPRALLPPPPVTRAVAEDVDSLVVRIGHDAVGARFRIHFDGLDEGLSIEIHMATGPLLANPCPDVTPAAAPLALVFANLTHGRQLSRSKIATRPGNG